MYQPLRRLALVALLVLLATALSWAEPAPLHGKIRVKFMTEPADCDVSVRLISDPPSVPPHPLGKAGEEILIDLDNARGSIPWARVLHDASTFTIVFSRHGYQSAENQFSTSLISTYLQSRAFHQGHPLILPTNGQSVALAWQPGLSTLPDNKWMFRAVVAGLGTVLLAVAWGFSRERRRRAAQVDNERRRDIMSRVVPSADFDPLIGKNLGRYFILERLGRGGMADVYRAIANDGDASDEMALKVIHAQTAENQEFQERFKREVQVCQKLRHPNIVALYDYGNVEGRYYMVMELVRGRMLRDVLQSGAGMKIGDAIELLAPIVGAIAFAHENGVVHRDLKPENVMVTNTGVIKVMDFGLARAHNSATVTETGSVLGTPQYMAPEQITRAEMVPSIDQYALGVMAYEMLSGHLPFEADDTLQVIMMHLAEPAPPLKNHRPDLPMAVNDVVMQMLAKSPAERYPSVNEAFAALRQAASMVGSPQ